MFSQSVWYRLLMLAALVLVPLPAFAAPMLSISSQSADGSTFVLRGERMDGVAGLEVRIGYDGATLRNPRVSMGGLASGMVNAVNPTNPIRMALVGTRPMSGGGIIATITFDRTGSSPGNITSLTGSAHGGNPPQTIPMASSSIVNPVAVAEPVSPQENPDSDKNLNIDTVKDQNIDTDKSQSVGTSGRTVVGGTLTFPGQESPDNSGVTARTAQAESDEHRLQRDDAAPVPQDERESVETKTPQQDITPPKPVVSVLERFRQFQGEKTVQNLTSLFRQDPADKFTQVPPIGISDGKATVTLAIAMNTGDRAPNFAFTAARYVALHRIDEGWEIEAKPDKGAVKAGVSMLYNNLVQEFPITVAPKVDLVPGKPRPVTEADFNAFLKNRGSAGAPKYDLNKDGRRDYMDDYIFTANYLVQMEEQAKKKKDAK